MCHHQHRTIARQRMLSLLTLVALLISVLSTPVFAQDSGSIQVIEGNLQKGQSHFYTLPDLKMLQKVYVLVESTSGNLDPFAALADITLDREQVSQEFGADVEKAIAEGRDPLTVIPEVANHFFLKWDDDSGPGYTAMFEYLIPTNGVYQLIIFDSPGQSTFGDYRLTIGLDAPEALSGKAAPRGEAIAFLDTTGDKTNVAVQETRGELTESRTSTFHTVQDLKAGDTLYAYVKTTDGDLHPILLLEDFGGKALATANFSGAQQVASLQHTVDEDVSNYHIRIIAGKGESGTTTGSYTLLVGINEPSVLTGSLTQTAGVALHEPTQVLVGIKMDQITGVDQKAENFGIAATLQMEWNDPGLAFSPDECDCRFKQMNVGAFEKLIADKDLTWPEFILFNQQGRRDAQSQTVVLTPTGRTIYYERFSATLQAPDFNFRNFPFDTQQFYIRVRSVLPDEYYTYSELPDFSGLGDQLGEEEWIIEDYQVETTLEDGNAQFSFGFQSSRHLLYYVSRVFIPIFIIILVSWFTFFLKDYGKRVDVASGNLLVFIAFNWTISGDLPRLGYVTFLDALIVSTFIITGVVVVFNVWLKRLEVNQKESWAQTIDKYSIWLYPILYVASFAFVWWFFV
ncbi:MAG TPA: hypothetical protein G4N94_07835 [Caldilineae bacterium]|nr:hypothetical protein [Caldilineae bacterium]